MVELQDIALCNGQYLPSAGFTLTGSARSIKLAILSSSPLGKALMATHQTYPTKPLRKANYS